MLIARTRRPLSLCLHQTDKIECKYGNSHDRLHALVENSIACILGALSVRCNLGQSKKRDQHANLRKDVAHRLRRLDVVVAHVPQGSQYLHLQERVSNPTDVVIRTESGKNQALENSD